MLSCKSWGNFGSRASGVPSRSQLLWPGCCASDFHRERLSSEFEEGRSFPWSLPYAKITLGPHVTHMCSHVGHMCCSNFTRLPTWGRFSTCETHMRSHMCTSCVSHVTHMNPNECSCGLLSLSITLTCEINIWNWNNTQNPHVNFMWFFRKGLAGQFKVRGLQ